MACNHKWRWTPNWYGDPNVINGTADCSDWRCQLCDAVSTARRPTRGDEVPDCEIEEHIVEQA